MHQSPYITSANNRDTPENESQQIRAQDHRHGQGQSENALAKYTTDGGIAWNALPACVKNSGTGSH
ncbi:hypothetical protein [Pseudomonas aeruginosa]|uniref:hypothetical protein n=1 Tax=Pseudomonas aeruginosa TaxID=287 RepID=UPI0013DF048F|nr:hypothetical protein [Pseudomonas aeruginosa]